MNRKKYDWERYQEEKIEELRKEILDLRLSTVPREEYESVMRRVSNYLERTEGQTEAAKILRISADERGGKPGKRHLTDAEEPARIGVVHLGR